MIFSRGTLGVSNVMVSRCLLYIHDVDCLAVHPPLGSISRLLANNREIALFQESLVVFRLSPKVDLPHTPLILKFFLFSSINVGMVLTHSSEEWDSTLRPARICYELPVLPLIRDVVFAIL